ncbi:MAG: hypothetical protein ABI539_15695 [Acidobacteriota bacterium]
MDSKRQKIVAAIIARMETILTTGGYTTNIGQNVHDWRVNFQDDELPAVSVCDLPATAADESQRGKLDRTIWLMPVQIRAYAKKGETPANVRHMIKDIQAAIRVDDQFIVTGQPLLMGSYPETEGFIIPEDSFEVVGGTVQFTAMFITQRFSAEQ